MTVLLYRTKQNLEEITVSFYIFIINIIFRNRIGRWLDKEFKNSFRNSYISLEYKSMQLYMIIIYIQYMLLKCLNF